MALLQQSFQVLQIEDNMPMSSGVEEMPCRFPAVWIVDSAKQVLQSKVPKVPFLPLPRAGKGNEGENEEGLKNCQTSSLDTIQK